MPNLTPQQEADNAAVIAQWQSALEATRARRNAARTGSVATSPDYTNVMDTATGLPSISPATIWWVPKPAPMWSYNTNSPTTSNPGNAITQPMPGSASSILWDGFGAEDPFVAQYTQDQLNAYNQTIDPQAAYDEKVKQRQAQIDATNAMYRDQLNQARIRGQGRIGSGTAMQARGGLLGSDFWTAQTNQIQNANTEVENSIEQERLVAVNQILSEAQKDATAEIAAKRAAKEAGGAAYLAYLSGASERKASKTSKAAQLLLSLGKSPQDISDAELKQAGISRQDLTMEYTAGKSAQEAASAAAGLATQKTQAEIAKLQQDVANGVLDRSKYYEVGNKIYEQGTNKFISDAAFNPYSGAFQVSPGNQIYDPVTNTFKAAPVNTGWATGDLRVYRSQYPNEAWSGTNNPGGISAWPGSSFVKLLEQNGVQVAGYNQRPEWWPPYVVFPTIEEGMKAYNLLWSQPSYQNLTVGQALQKWGTGSLPGVDTNKRVSDLTPQEVTALQSAQIRKESPGLYTLMQKWGTQSATEQNDYNNIASTIQDLINKKDYAGSLRVRNPGLNVFANENTEFLASVEKLSSQLLNMDWERIKKIFWPQISNSDIEAIKLILRNGLDPANMKPETFEATLKEIYNKLNLKNANIPPVSGATNQSAITKPGTLSNWKTFTVEPPQ